MGKDLGYLPGVVQEKMSVWMAPIRDAIEFLSENSPERYYHLQETGILQVEPLTYIRGRSIPHTFFLVDEVQNISSHEIKTMISRMGEGSKLVLTGDIHQIDNEYLDAFNNGLTRVVERFKKSSLAGHVNLIKGERSELANLATKLL